MGLHSVAFLPAHWMRSKPRDGEKGNAMMQTNTVDELQELVDLGIIVLTPPQVSALKKKKKKNLKLTSIDM